MSVPFVKISKGGFVKIGQVGDYIILNNIIHKGDTLTTDRFLPIYRGHDFINSYNDTLTIVPENGDVSIADQNYNINIQCWETLNPNRLPEIQLQYVYQDTQKAVIINDFSSGYGFITIDLKNNNLENIAKQKFTDGASYPLAIKLENDEFFYIDTHNDSYKTTYYAGRTKINRETGSVNNIHGAKHSCRECGRQILGQSQRYVLYTMSHFRHYLSFYLYDKITKSVKKLLQTGTNSYEIHNLAGSGIFKRNEENEQYLDLVFAYSLEYYSNSERVRFRKVLIDLKNGSVLYNKLESIENISSFNSDFNYNGTSRKITKYQFIHKTTNGEYYLTLVYLVNRNYSGDYPNFKKIFLFKINGVENENDFLDKNKLDNITLEYVKSFTLNNYLRGMIPLVQNNRNYWIIYTDDDVYKMSFDEESKEWTFKSLGIPNTFILMKDTYSRIWILDKDYNLYLLTTNLPFKVKIYRENEGEPIVYEDEPIETNIYVSVYNFEGERIQAKIKLLIVSNNAVFIIDENNTSKEIEITTKTDGDVKIPVRIIDKGEVFFDVFAIE